MLGMLHCSLLPRTGSAEMDRDVLLDFYQTMDGASWSKNDGWARKATDLGSWHGVTTNADGRVVKLELGDVTPMGKKATL